jgi:hypothetical protein
MRKAYPLALLGALLLWGCAKEAGLPDAPGLSNFRTYDLIPMDAQRSSDGGFVLQCKRAIGDPKAAFAQFMDGQGNLTSRIDYGQLPLRVENVNFLREDIAITDILPWGDGSYVLAGFGRETELDNRLHALVYRVNANGSLLGAPIRRYIAAGSVLETQNDLNRAYRTTVKAVRDATGKLFLAVRYETASTARCRLFGINLEGGGGPTGNEILLDQKQHRLQSLWMRDNGELWLIMDASVSPTETKLHVRVFDSSFLSLVDEGFIDKKNARVTALLDEVSQVRIIGIHDRGTDEPWSFQARGTNPGNLIPSDIGQPTDRAGTAYAATWDGANCHVAVSNHEARVLSPEGLRDDRVSDLQWVTLGSDGERIAAQDILKGHGARALGCFMSDTGPIIIGAMHPYLNADYAHGFYLVLSRD